MTLVILILQNNAISTLWIPVKINVKINTQSNIQSTISGVDIRI